MIQERKKLLINIINKAVTTAVVVDCPTPFAPPVVVNPQLHPITAMRMPKQHAFTIALRISQVFKKFRAESRKTVSERLYTFVAIAIPQASPLLRIEVLEWAA